MTEQFFTG